MRCRPLLTILTLVIVVAPWDLAQSGVRTGNQTQPKQKQKVAKAQVKTRQAHDKNSHADSVNKLDSSQDRSMPKQSRSIRGKAMVLRLVAQYRMGLWLLRMREF